MSDGDRHHGLVDVTRAAEKVLVRRIGNREHVKSELCLYNVFVSWCYLLLFCLNLTHPPGQQLDEPSRILLWDPVHTVGYELESDIFCQLLHHPMSELE